ncbi:MULTISPECIES: iron ABC transporter permease [unclassified Roseateles]|uniref:ABC transporter permease n=1 Tax=unclassified Roseateles TaxID=2626991 RepID=UPI0006F4F778|nr:MULTISPECIES: iron ABC transporter permease [unclassified Roseateles]KQW43663.1 iron ABC transporter permease [Pelomonas sp. Root405]KRA71401.1 iron ABC transporter permease [Pelomonas sp. Root662]
MQSALHLPVAARPRRLPSLRALALLAAALIAAPLLSVAFNVFTPGTAGTWQHLLATVLPDYVVATLWLCVGVGIGVAVLGVGAAWLVTRYEFPLRGSFEWALLLPLAMPAYVMAYAYTDLLQFVGPVQSWLRESFGWRRGDYWFPDVRSLGGAIAMFSLVLYPYVYMLARTAFMERAGGMIEVGRTLGLTPFQAFHRLSLPLARPAIAGGVALALMETLADYGTVSYFAVQTFTTGIYRAWFSLGDRTAAAQLAMVLLLFVVMVLALEKLSRGGSRFADSTLRSRGVMRVPLQGPRAALALLACALPLAGGFLLPAGVMLHMALTEGDAQWGTRFFTLAGNSVLVAGATSLLATALALLIAYAGRVDQSAPTRWAHRVAGLGYALPGSVIAVGVLIPVTQLDHALAALLRQGFGIDAGLLLTGTIAALVYACVVRYLTAALQAMDAGLARITPRMEQAARTLGHTPAQTLWRVHLPLLRGSALTAGLLVFIDVMKELPATLVMRPFNFDTLATQAYTLASDERLAEASTSALAIVVVGLVPMVVLCRHIVRGTSSHGT